jgi:hypothetical protein
LLGNGQRIFELQSVDERPIADGYFVIIDMQEQEGLPFQGHYGPRAMQIWVHTPLDNDRTYNVINRILNRIDALILPIENQRGTDNIRCTMVEFHARSRNTFDPAWKTTTRSALYTVAYDESAA